MTRVMVAEDEILAMSPELGITLFNIRRLSRVRVFKADRLIVRTGFRFLVIRDGAVFGPAKLIINDDGRCECYELACE